MSAELEECELKKPISCALNHLGFSLVLGKGVADCKQHIIWLISSYVIDGSIFTASEALEVLNADNIDKIELDERCCLL